LITRPRLQAEQFANALIEVGAQPIFFPTIEIIPTDDFRALAFARRSLKEFDWLIFTSIHSVEAL
jgi:Uroporphyrinogen-III synthase